MLETAFDHTAPQFHGYMDGLSLHYYTVPGPDWDHKGSATEFTTGEWYKTLAKAEKIE